MTRSGVTARGCENRHYIPLETHLPHRSCIFDNYRHIKLLTSVSDLHIARTISLGKKSRPFNSDHSFPGYSQIYRWCDISATGILVMGNDEHTVKIITGFKADSLWKHLNGSEIRIRLMQVFLSTGFLLGFQSHSCRPVSSTSDPAFQQGNLIFMKRITTLVISIIMLRCRGHDVIMIM